MKKNYTIQTVKNAMQILHLFTLEKKEWTLTEIAGEKGLSISTTGRLVGTLEDYGYLQRNPRTKEYRLGLALFRLSGVLTTTMEHREVQQIMRMLSDAFGEAVHIAVLEGTHTIFLDKIEAEEPVSLGSDVGNDFPAYATGCGKVLLAYKEPEEQERLIELFEEKGFTPFASETVPDAEVLRNQMNRILEEGFVTCSNEITEGNTSIAAPVYNHTEAVVASISITGPTKRMELAQIEESITEAGKELSNRLGYVY